MSDKIQTHHPRCFLDPKHHDCAVRYALDLERAVLDYRRASDGRDHGDWKQAQSRMFAMVRAEAITPGLQRRRMLR